MSGVVFCECEDGEVVRCNLFNPISGKSPSVGIDNWIPKDYIGMSLHCNNHQGDGHNEDHGGYRSVCWVLESIDPHSYLPGPRSLKALRPENLRIHIHRRDTVTPPWQKQSERRVKEPKWMQTLVSFWNSSRQLFSCSFLTNRVEGPSARSVFNWMWILCLFYAAGVISVNSQNIWKLEQDTRFFLILLSQRKLSSCFLAGSSQIFSDSCFMFSREYSNTILQ